MSRKDKKTQEDLANNKIAELLIHLFAKHKNIRTSVILMAICMPKNFKGVDGGMYEATNLQVAEAIKAVNAEFSAMNEKHGDDWFNEEYEKSEDEELLKEDIYHYEDNEDDL